MFSRRIPPDLTMNRIAQALEHARLTGPLLDLTESNPTRAGFVADPQRVADLLASPDAARYDPDPRGWVGARDAVSAYYAARGCEVSVDRILLTASTSEGYALLFKLLCDAGDDVLVPTPSYPLFEHLANAECIRAVPYPLAFDGRWQVDVEALERAVTPESKAVVVVSPNNPTGSVLTRGELDAVVRVCQRHELVLICDEVFADYPNRLPHDAARAPYDDTGVLTFTLNGLSKIAGLPQLKAGWMVASGPGPLVDAAMPRLEFLADLYLSVGSPVQRALPGLLELAPAMQSAIRASLAANLLFLRSELQGTAVDVLPLEAGWTAVLRVPRILDDETFALRLIEQEATVVQPGYFYDFDGEGFIVVSLLTTAPVFQEGIRRLLALVERL